MMDDDDYEQLPQNYESSSKDRQIENQFFSCDIKE